MVINANYNRIKELEDLVISQINDFLYDELQREYGWWDGYIEDGSITEKEFLEKIPEIIKRIKINILDYSG